MKCHLKLHIDFTLHDITVTDEGCRGGAGGGLQGECLHGYVFLIAGCVALIVVIVSAVTAGVVCCRHLHKR